LQSFELDVLLINAGAHPIGPMLPITNFRPPRS